MGKGFIVGITIFYGFLVGLNINSFVRADADWQRWFIAAVIGILIMAWSSIVLTYNRKR